MFHHFRLLRAEFSYKLCANRSERFYIMLVHNGVPELVYECQGQGQVRPTMAIIQRNEGEARDAFCINNFRLILRQWASCNPLTQFSSNFGSRSGLEVKWAQILSVFLGTKMCISEAVIHAESNGGIFMFVSSLQRTKMHFKISNCDFRADAISPLYNLKSTRHTWRRYIFSL